MSYFFTYVFGDAIDERRARMLALMTLFFGGAVAQLGARLDGIEEVEGSNPFGSTKNNPAIRSEFFRELLSSVNSYSTRNRAGFCPA